MKEEQTKERERLREFAWHRLVDAKFKEQYLSQYVCYNPNAVPHGKVSISEASITFHPISANVKEGVINLRMSYLVHFAKFERLFLDIDNGKMTDDDAENAYYSLVNEENLLRVKEDMLGIVAIKELIRRPLIEMEKYLHKYWDIEPNSKPSDREWYDDEPATETLSKITQTQSNGTHWCMEASGKEPKAGDRITVIDPVAG
ncbi:hypothetical protein Barb6XT_03044 [Bacteroidales bacterium Barb6XT]|nr:hypothetical protein Barb6XT_03044 [Bacteroidales bacterium Barb6XT]